MARLTVNQCDICGAADGPDNPVTATLTMPKAKGKKDDDAPTSGYFISMMWGDKPTVDCLDLCLDCARPLVAMLREVTAMRAAEKPPKQPQAPKVRHDALLRALGDITVEATNPEQPPS